MSEFDPVVREATLDDLDILLRHRRAMFSDMGRWDETALDKMAAASEDFFASAVNSGSYHAWVVEADDEVLAGGGVLLTPFPPAPNHLLDRRGWILNVYTEPEHRERGLARLLVETIVQWCRDAGLPFVSLHASDAGRHLYETLGFEPTAEMRLTLR